MNNATDTGNVATVTSGALLMALVLIVSNYLVQFPLPGAAGNWLTYAAFTYPIAFLVTDSVNYLKGAQAARRVVLAGFIVGVPLSFAFNYFTAPDGAWLDATRIALASGAAFAAAHLADIRIFSALRRRAAWWLPPFASSGAASLLDTTLFFMLAFAGTDVPWLSLAAGDLIAKALMLFILLPPYRIVMKRSIA